MNQRLTWIFSIVTLFFSLVTHATTNSSCCPTTCAKSQNLYQPHAFSVSASREILLEKAAWYPTVEHPENWHGTFGVNFEYMHTFGNCCTTTTQCCSSLGSLPFWATNGGNTMTIGSNASGSDIDGYQLGLGPLAGTTSLGTVTLNPIVYQAGADFLIYVGAHSQQHGFFFKAHAPVGVININPGLTFTDTIQAIPYQPGLLNYNATGATTATVPAPYANIQQAFQGGIPAGFLDAMTNGLISINRKTSATFGDAELAIGYNFFTNQSGHVGIAARLSIPTGNTAEGVYVLEPIFGRNGHWGIGGELISHWKFWQSKNSDTKFAQFFFDGIILHLCKSQQVRSFDLKANGAGSKYLLLAKYIGNTAHTASEFQNQILNAVNITTIGVESTFNIEGNFALGFNMHWNNWSFEIGYEGWGRSCEQLTLCATCPSTINFNEYAVLGRQTPYATSGTPLTALTLCEPLANIGESENHVNTFTPTAEIKDASLSANRIPQDPATALNIDGQRASQIYTSKPYAEFRYTWSENEYAPYLAIMGGAEIPNTHKNEAAKMWNLGFNGGIAF